MFHIPVRRIMTAAATFLLAGCVTGLPASRGQRYRNATAACQQRPNGDECVAMGKHAWHLGQKDEARSIWSTSCFEYRRPNACIALREEFTDAYLAGRRKELLQNQSAPASACANPFPSIRWAASMCMDQKKQTDVMNSEVLNCIDTSTGKVFENDCDRGKFLREKWCSRYLKSGGRKMSPADCLTDPRVVPENVKNGFKK